jgi:hypothetical protein
MMKSQKITTIATSLAVMLSASAIVTPASAWVRPGLGDLPGVGKPGIAPNQIHPMPEGLRPIRPGRPIIPGNPGHGGWPGHAGNWGHGGNWGGAIAGAAIGGLAVGAIAAAAASHDDCQLAIYNRRGQFIGYRRGDCDGDD